jgi:hypothetical protein
MTSDSRTIELAAVVAEQAALLGSGISLPVAAALLAARAAVLRHELHDIGIELTVLSGPWLSWLRVPVSEVDRLDLGEKVSDSSYRSATHYYLDASDGDVYRAHRRAEGSGELKIASVVSKNVLNVPGVERLDDYRARDWTPADSK